MSNPLRYDIADQRLSYFGKQEAWDLEPDRIAGFNHRHKTVLANYDLTLDDLNILTLSDRITNESNLGVFRNRQVRQSVVLSAALSALAVGLHGRGSANEIPREEATSDKLDSLKRANDRTAAQVMAEVLQTTTETLPAGEEILIESTLTEGVRNKPGKEVGGLSLIHI